MQMLGMVRARVSACSRLQAKSKHCGTVKGGQSKRTQIPQQPTVSWPLHTPRGPCAFAVGILRWRRWTLTPVRLHHHPVSLSVMARAPTSRRGCSCLWMTRQSGLRRFEQQRNLQRETRQSKHGCLHCWAAPCPRSGDETHPRRVTAELLRSTVCWVNNNCDS